MTSDDPGLTRFNTLPTDQAERALAACCAAPVWVAAVASGRPYADRVAALDRAAKELAALDWRGVRQAIDVHPRIGERPAGDEREASWSRREQPDMDSVSAQVRAALAEMNRAYEERFGHVLLIFATGRTHTEMLANARQRLAHDAATERTVVREELGRIVALRLERLLD